LLAQWAAVLDGAALDRALLFQNGTPMTDIDVDQRSLQCGRCGRTGGRLSDPFARRRNRDADAVFERWQKLAVTATILAGDVIWTARLVSINGEVIRLRFRSA
jgi:hypothetical protein